MVDQATWRGRVLRSDVLESKRVMYREEDLGYTQSFGAALPCSVRECATIIEHSAHDGIAWCDVRHHIGQRTRVCDTLLISTELNRAMAQRSPLTPVVPAVIQTRSLWTFWLIPRPIRLGRPSYQMIVSSRHDRMCYWVYSRASVHTSDGGEVSSKIVETNTRAQSTVLDADTGREMRDLPIQGPLWTPATDERFLLARASSRPLLYSVQVTGSSGSDTRTKTARHSWHIQRYSEAELK